LFFQSAVYCCCHCQRTKLELAVIHGRLGPRALCWFLILYRNDRRQAWASLWVCGQQMCPGKVMCSWFHYVNLFLFCLDYSRYCTERNVWDSVSLVETLSHWLKQCLKTDQTVRQMRQCLKTDGRLKLCLILWDKNTEEWPGRCPMFQRANGIWIQCFLFTSL
jgi:hypothetical protein